MQDPTCFKTNHFRTQFWSTKKRLFQNITRPHGPIFLVFKTCFGTWIYDQIELDQQYLKQNLFQPNFLSNQNFWIKSNKTNFILALRKLEAKMEFDNDEVSLF